MNELLSRTWQSLAGRGAVALIFGILAAFWPGITLSWLLVIFAAYALIGGMVSAVVAFQNRKVNSNWWLIFLIGLIWIAGGMTAIILPGLTALMLVLIIGATALASGIVEVVMAIRLRKVIRGEGLLILEGIISIAFGVFVFFFHGAGALALVWLISTYATISGLLLFVLAWRAKKWGGSMRFWLHELPHGIS
jgi:uncharacterized membrane protein HdeD (DUF308 family)